MYLQTGSDAIVLGTQPPSLSREETELLLGDLNRHLAEDGLVFKAFHPQRWYLHVLDERFTKALPLTTPPSEVGAGNIFPKLPQSDDKYWHQLMNEIQMLLHIHSVNQAREERGQRPVNGVWFWGEQDRSWTSTALSHRDVSLGSTVDSTASVLPTSVQGGGITGQVIASATKARWQKGADTNLASVPDSGDVLVILDQLQSAVVAEQPQLWQQALSSFCLLYTSPSPRDS